jgi:polyisoprenoid-binding protein YceI
MEIKKLPQSKVEFVISITWDNWKIFLDEAVSKLSKEIKIEGDIKEAVVDLTMKGVTKTLIVPVTVTSEEGSAMFKIDTRVKISDYSIAYGPVLDEVRIMLEGKIVKK